MWWKISHTIQQDVKIKDLYVEITQTHKYFITIFPYHWDSRW